MERKDEGVVRWAESETAHGTCEKIEHESLDGAGEVEIELPAALKDLLDRLHGEAVKRVPKLESEEYGGYFREGGGESPQRTEVRLKVLRALGNCRTLRRFDTHDVNHWELSVQEWEVLLVGLQTNASLEEIAIYPLKSAETEALIGPFWQDLFRQVENLNSLQVWNGLRGEFATKVGLGLRANSHNKLRSLLFEYTGGRYSLVPSCMTYAQIISSAPHLVRLFVRTDMIRPTDAAEIEALANALRHSRNLKEIRITPYDEDEMIERWGDVLVDAYSGLPSNPILECLSLDRGLGVTAEHLAHLIRGNILKIQIDYQDSFTLDEWESVGRSFLHAHVLEYMSIHLLIRDMWPTEESEDLSTCLAELWKASNKSPLLQIQCECLLYSSTMLEKKLEFLQEALSDTYLKDINLSFHGEGVKILTSVVDSLASNTSVQSLFIDLARESAEECRYLFHHLRDNASIRKLTISSYWRVHDDHFRDLMDLLEINFTLEEIDVRNTPWENDGRRALIEEALGRNKRRAGYFSILSRAGLSFAGAKAGRVFLCGLPFAGKTQMKVTMMKTMSKESKSPSLFYTIKEKLKLMRTKGIEVEILCDDASRIISIWDLAGQQFFELLIIISFQR